MRVYGIIIYYVRNNMYTSRAHMPFIIYYIPSVVVVAHFPRQYRCRDVYYGSPVQSARKTPTRYSWCTIYTLQRLCYAAVNYPFTHPSHTLPHRPSVVHAVYGRPVDSVILYRYPGITSYYTVIRTCCARIICPPRFWRVAKMEIW